MVRGVTSSKIDAGSKARVKEGGASGRRDQRSVPIGSDRAGMKTTSGLTRGWFYDIE